MPTLNPKLLKRLTRVKETPVAPAWMLAAIEGRLDANAAATTSDTVLLEREVTAVKETRARLTNLPPNWPLTSNLL